MVVMHKPLFKLLFKKTYIRYFMNRIIDRPHLYGLKKPVDQADLLQDSVSENS